MGAMAASIKDVAKRAGVSISTVSRILNSSANVDAAKERAVREAIAYYQYEPNQFGRGLVKQCTQMIGIYLYSGIALLDPIYNLELVRGIEEVLCQENYSLVLLTDKPGNTKPSFYRYIREKRIDGLVVSGLSSQIRHDPAFVQLIESEYPVTYVGKRFHENGMNVYAQFEEYHVDMVRKLYERGHRRIMIFFDQMHNHYMESICQEILKTMPGVRLKLRELDDEPDYFALRQEILAAVTADGFTAACCPTVRDAEKLMHTCTQLRISVPEQLSIIAVEHRLGEGIQSYPAISVVYVPAKAMGRAAAEQLIAVLRDDKEVKKHVEFSAEFIGRNSIAERSPEG